MKENINSEILLSIVIPIYNVEKYIAKCLQSIYSQIEHFPVEVILVNDGTPDGSMEIAKKYESDQTIIINQTNQGLSEARKQGMKAAHGKYVWFVDSDDWIADGAIKKICNWLEMLHSEVFIVGISAYDEKGNPISSFHAVSPVREITTKKGAEWILTPNFERGPMQIFIMKRDFLQRHQLKFIKGLLHEDLDFAPRMLIETSDVTYIPEKVYCYLIRTKGSITSSVNPKRFTDIYSILVAHENLLSSCPKESSQQLAIKATQWMLLRTLVAYLKRQNYEDFNLCSPEYSPIIRRVAWRSVFCKMKMTFKVKFLLTSIYPNIYKYIKW